MPWALFVSDGATMTVRPLYITCGGIEKERADAAADLINTWLGERHQLAEQVDALQVENDQLRGQLADLQAKYEAEQGARLLDRNRVYFFGKGA